MMRSSLLKWQDFSLQLSEANDFVGSMAEIRLLANSFSYWNDDKDDFRNTPLAADDEPQ